MKVLKNILSIIFIVYTAVMMVVYLGVIYEKIAHPHHRSRGLDFTQLVLWGLLGLFFLFVDIILVKRLVRQIKAKYSGPKP
jgi:hypothetical protein